VFSTSQTAVALGIRGGAMSSPSADPPAKNLAAGPGLTVIPEGIMLYICAVGGN